MARMNAEQWSKHVERWKDSGLTAKEFAAETGLSASTLSNWRWKLSAAERECASRKDGPSRTSKARSMKAQEKDVAASGFIELPVAAWASAPVMLELVLGDVRVRVPSGFDEATLTRVVRALGAAR